MNAPFIGNAPPALDERPKCQQCKKPLSPHIVTIEERITEKQGFHLRPVSREWTGGYHGYGHFCTLRCAARFANAVVDARRAATSKATQGAT